MNGGSGAVSSPAPARRTLREILSFLAVGGVGFVIEAVILTMLTLYAAWSPWQARIPSFLTAVLTTWALNRKHTFADRGLQRRSTEAFLYTAIQGGGALINLGIFGVCLAVLPQFARVPVIPLAIGAVGGFVFNYVLSSKWLYSRFRLSKSG
ncbi:GtrA family protein [Peristeroidobacter soli]|uniref:GtrA family protein n=1 Tax=Peristeroidobacter soli TaxID=2497877 RepID=UPI00101E1480|nr:GtrA family protein [Peristeroidobacter soli]